MPSLISVVPVMKRMVKAVKMAMDVQSVRFIFLPWKVRVYMQKKASLLKQSGMNQMV